MCKRCRNAKVQARRTELNRAATIACRYCGMTTPRHMLNHSGACHDCRGPGVVDHPTVLVCEGEDHPIRARVLHETQQWLGGKLPSECQPPRRGDETLLAQWLPKYRVAMVRHGEEFSAKMSATVKAIHAKGARK